MSSVTAGGPGFVAVGQTNAPTSEGWSGDAAVWTSVDGITWSLIPNQDPPLGGPGLQMMEAITVGGPGLVAVGTVLDEPGDGLPIWTSIDGIVWSRVPPDPSLGWLTLRSVTVGGPGLVAVGQHEVFTSPDGITWTPVPHDPAVFGHGTIYGVISGGPGLVAFGELNGQGVM